jgi:hypothetical protein
MQLFNVNPLMQKLAKDLPGGAGIFGLIENGVQIAFDPEGLDSHPEFTRFSQIHVQNLFDALNQAAGNEKFKIDQTGDVRDLLGDIFDLTPNLPRPFKFETISIKKATDDASLQVQSAVEPLCCLDLGMASNIASAVNNYFTELPVDGEVDFEVEGEVKKYPATLQHKINGNYPEVLFINLKRDKFVRNEETGELVRRRDVNPVIIDETLDLGPYNAIDPDQSVFYKFIGAIVHKGDDEDGHYATYIVDPENAEFIFIETLNTDEVPWGIGMTDIERRVKLLMYTREKGAGGEEEQSNE